jgi:hypothetical protein
VSSLLALHILIFFYDGFGALFSGGAGFVVEVFKVMGDGQGFVGDAFGAGGPDGIGQAGPVIVAVLQFVPTGLKVFLPFG